MASLSSTEMAAVVAALTEALRETPGATARELSRTTGYDRKVLNPVLYGQRQLFTAGQGEGAAPRWYLIDGANEVTPYEPTRTAAPQETNETPEPDEFDALFDEAQFDPDVVKKFQKDDPTPTRTTPVIDATPDNPLGLYAWQREALTAWTENGHRGIIDAVTGAGKTRLAIATIAEELAVGGKTLVLVPTVVLLHQWCEIILSFFPDARVGLVGDGHDDDFRRHDVVVAVLASARNRRFELNGAEGLLVADECHRAAADKSQIALSADFTKRLGLSATHERMDDAHETVLLPYFEDVVFTLDYRRAIDDGVITGVRAAFVGVSFTDEEKQKYIEITRGLSKHRRALITKYGCRSEPFSAFLDDVIRLTKKGKREEGMVAQRWLKLWGEKKDLLAETPAKTDAITALIPAINDAGRTLIFTQSIASANRIAELLRDANVAAVAHHSEIAMSDREATMRAFAAGELQALVSVQTLEEGVDVPDADLAIIVASSKQRRQMIQRMGRVLRRKDDGRDARFVHLCDEMTDEDPRIGAHETFIEELVDVARASGVFLRERLAELRAFIAPHR